LLYVITVIHVLCILPVHINADVKIIGAFTNRVSVIQTLQDFVVEKHNIVTPKILKIVAVWNRLVLYKSTAAVNT